MADERHLDAAQARDVEEELFATRRQQASRHVPVPLPRQNFWEMVGKLLADIDSDIQQMLVSGTTGLRLQNAQKRQANVRRIASELARKRLVSMMQHVSSQSLRIDTQMDLNQELPPLDWQRHDPAEKAFYHGMLVQMDRFKKEIDWETMQKGILGEVVVEKNTHSRGTMQLDSFVDTSEGLTGQMPPELIIEDKEPDIDMTDSQYDEEDRMYDDEWPDINEYAKSGLEDETVSKAPENVKSQPSSKEKHMAAMELAPSKSTTNSVVDEVQLEQPKEEEVNEDMIRIRVVQSLPDPIMLGDDVEITLAENDIHFIDKDTADWLVESGVAEIENL